MEIQSQTVGDRYVLSLVGRFDASWSEYVGSAIEAAIQRGEHQIEIDLGNVHYMSSAGIGVLLKYRKRLLSVHGLLRVVNPVAEVLSVLRLMKLEDLLLGRMDSDTDSNHAQDKLALERTLDRHGVQFESYRLAASLPLRGEWIGFPERLKSGMLNPSDAVRVPLQADRLVLGLGSFDGVPGLAVSPVSALCRFGESLAVAGIGIEQSTDGSRVPDFQISRGDLVPDLQLLYGLSVTGDFAHLIRFEAGRSERGSFRLSRFLSGVLDAFNCQLGAFAIVVEAAAVVGASLIQSPTRAAGQSLWTFPSIRNWLSFTSEQNQDRMLALIVGVAGRAVDEELQPFLRPLQQGNELQGHFHAAVFPYRPLPKGMLALHDTVHELFRNDAPQSVLHLLADDRPIEGVGETELMRGACWFGPLTDCVERV
jgi:anti-anti-sigma factor